MLKKMPRKSPPRLIAVEIITTFFHDGIDNCFMEKYIVAARSTSSAVAGLQLRENEKILKAREMSDYKLVIVK